MLACFASRSAQASEIDFWHPWPHANRTIQNLARQYTARTGVEVRVRLYNPSSENPWKRGASPDLVGLYRPAKRSIESLADAGAIANIEPEMARGWYRDFSQGMLETFRLRTGRQSGTFGVPLTGQVNLFVYNKALFRRAKIGGIPATWRDLMLISQKLSRLGIMPYAGGFASETPPLASAYEWSRLGLHLLMETYRGHYPYTSRAWVDYLGMYSDMRRFGFTNGAAARMSGVSAIKAMLDGRVAMVFTDASFESIRSSYKPAFNDWGVFGVPVDKSARFLPRLPGGPAECLVVNSRSSRRDLSLGFARWLTRPRQQLALANGASSLPATPSMWFSSKLRAPLRVFASTGMQDQSLDLRTYENPRVLSVLYSGIGRILSGSDTPQGVARRTQLEKGQ